MKSFDTVKVASPRPNPVYSFYGNKAPAAYISSDGARTYECFSELRGALVTRVAFECCRSMPLMLMHIARLFSHCIPKQTGQKGQAGNRAVFQKSIGVEDIIAIQAANAPASQVMRVAEMRMNSLRKQIHERAALNTRGKMLGALMSSLRPVVMLPMLKMRKYWESGSEDYASVVMFNQKLRYLQELRNTVSMGMVDS